MKDERHIQLGERVRAEREAQRLSQRKLAQMAGTSQSVVFNIEHGNNPFMTDTLFNLADALGVEAKDLL